MAVATLSSTGSSGPVTSGNYTAPADYVVDSTDAPSNTITSIGSGDTFTIGGSLDVGYNHTGSFSQSGGSVTVQASQGGTGFILGANAGSSGTYTMTGGTLSAVSAFIGADGSGTMNHSAGTATFSGTMYVGYNSGSNNTYNLSGTGSLSALYENIGFNRGSSGHFVQSGGTNTAKDVSLSQYPGGQGTYLLSGGTLSATEGVFVENGTFTQTGGSLTPGVLYLADGNASNVAAYVMSGGTLTIPSMDSASNFAVGASGSGTFTQTGGTISDNGKNSNNNLALGLLSGSSGTYHLNGGTLSVFGVGGYQGQSTFNFNGGTLQAQADNGNFMFGLTTAQVRNGGAQIDTNGFNVTVSQTLIHSTVSGDNAIDGGLTKVGSGTLTLTAYNTYTGGTFINGGTLVPGSSAAIADAGNLSFGGGTLQYSTANTSDYSGRIKNSTGAISLDTNGQSVTFTAALDNSNSGGLTKLGEGTLTLTGANTYTGQTLVNQGTLAVTGGGIGKSGATSDLTVNLGSGGTPAGTTPTAPAFTLSGNGTQVFFNSTYVGREAAGSVTQSGGTFTTGGVLYLGYSDTGATTGNGTYTLTGGTLNTNETQVGNGGTGAFNHSGGTQTVTTTFYLGLNGGTGTYNLSGNGTLQASTGVVGYTGTGTFGQSGGTANFGTGGLIVGDAAGTRGTYQLGTGSGNGATLNVSGPVYVGYGGTGTFNQQADGSFYGGGSPLYLGYNAGGNGTYNLSGSGIATGDGSTIGYAGTGTFNNTGGFDTVNGTLVLGHAAGSSGTYNLGNGGTLVAAQVATQGGTSTFNFDGGTLSPSANSTSFFQGLTSASVRNYGAKFDTAGYNVTVAQTLVHTGNQGDNATDGGLYKFGAGTLTLTAANTYNGQTTVYGGTLLVNNASGSGTGSGLVVLANTGILGGNGTVGGSVIAQAGATVAPGAGPQLSTARLTLGGTLTLQSNALLVINIGGTTGGTGYDQVFAGGGFTLGGNLQLSFLNGFTPTLGQNFTILDNTGNDVNSGTFANVSGGLYTGPGGGEFLVDYASNADGGLIPNDVTLTYLGANVVPEPGTWACLLVGLGAFAARHARRRERPGQA